MRNKRFLKIVQVVSGEPKLPVPPFRKPPVLPKLIENGFIRCENDVLSANFPVFENAVFETLSGLLRPTAEVASACMTDISDKAAAALSERAPAAVPPLPKSITDSTLWHVSPEKRRKTDSLSSRRKG